MKYQPKKDDFDKRQRDIQAIQDQVKKGAATMSEDAKAKLERDIDSKTKSLQRDTQEVSDDYEQDMGKVFQELGNKMLQIIEQYSYQNGYAAVLDVSNRQTSPVLWAAPSSNITADIIKLYDQAHPAAAGSAPRRSRLRHGAETRTAGQLRSRFSASDRRASAAALLGQRGPASSTRAGSVSQPRHGGTNTLRSICATRMRLAPRPASSCARSGRPARSTARN